MDQLKKINRLEMINQKTNKGEVQEGMKIEEKMTERKIENLIESRRKSLKESQRKRLQKKLSLKKPKIERSKLCL